MEVSASLYTTCSVFVIISLPISLGYEEALWYGVGAQKFEQ